MLPNAFIEIIIMLVLIWFFENKVLPQIICMFLTIWLIVVELADGTEWRYLILFAGCILYSGFQIFEIGKDKE